MSKLHRITDEPTAADLAAIEAEWPDIQADIEALTDPDFVDALVDEIYALEHPPNDLDRRRQRRITARITREVEASTRTAAWKWVA